MLFKLFFFLFQSKSRECQKQHLQEPQNFWGPGEDFFQFRVCRSILLNLIVWKSFQWVQWVSISPCDRPEEGEVKII